MDRDNNSEHPLLSSYRDDIEGKNEIAVSSPKANWTRSLHRPGALIAMLCVTLSSLIINVFLIWLQFRVSPQENELVQSVSPSSLLGKSAYTGLSLDTPSTHYHHTEYWSTNQTRADELWESIDTNPMVVALTDDFADAHHLLHSDRFPWDDSKGRYFVKVFHQLHCLKFIRRAFVDYQRGQPPQLNGQHVHHCLDTLRQDVICIADDTPMPTGDEARAIGDEQPMMCRNFDKLVKWVYAPERNACHRALSDYRSITHSIERYAFCEEGSENYMKMAKYFDKHGHVDPWS